MKKSLTTRTLKTNPSIPSINLSLSKRTIPRNSHTAITTSTNPLTTNRSTHQKPPPHKLSTPQKQLTNWCKIQQSILHNIYDLKQLQVVDQFRKGNEEEEERIRDRYEEIGRKIGEVEEERGREEREGEGIRGEMRMVMEDRRGEEMRGVDLISEREELEEIVEVYMKKFPEESEVLFQILNINLVLRHNDAQISTLQSQLQDDFLSSSISSSLPLHHLSQRIHNYRLALLSLQQTLNDFSTHSNKPFLRQILCHFYLQNKNRNNKDSENNNNCQLGIELWVCKSHLVTLLDEYVFHNYKWMKEGAWEKEYLGYLEVLMKIEIVYGEMQRFGGGEEAGGRGGNKREELEKLREERSGMEEKKSGLQEKIRGLWSQEQLFRLQCDQGKGDTKTMLNQIKTEQFKREENMRSIKQRLLQIKQHQQRSKSAKNSYHQSITQLQHKLQQKQNILSQISQQLLHLIDQHQKLETKLLPLTPSYQTPPSQHLDQQISALQKKLSKLQQKKQTIINSKISQYQSPNYCNPVSALHELDSNLVSPFSKCSKRSKSRSKNSRSASKIKKNPKTKPKLKPGVKQSTYHTISLKPAAEPLDKAIHRLVSFKKTLANDKMKLNKQMSKIMKNI